MSVSRRKFLLAGQTLLAAAALPIHFFGAASNVSFGSSKAANLASATKATFQPFVNSSFAVQANSMTTAWLTLLSVEDMNAKAAAPSTSSAFTGLRSPKAAPQVTDTFTLNFQGTGETLKQGTYELEHKTLGNFQLFLVPSGPTTYSATISHLQSALPIQAPRPITPVKKRAGVQEGLGSL